MLFSAGSIAAPMSGSGSSFDDQPIGSSDGFVIERKSPGWFGKPKTGSSQEELELAKKLQGEGYAGAAAKRYVSIVRYWGSSLEAPIAQKAYADILYDREDMEDAFREYQYLIKFYAGQFDYDLVLERQMKIANYLMTTPRGSFLFFPGFMDPERALPYFKQILQNGPTWKHAPEVQFNIGLINEEAGEANDAVLAYDAVMKKYRGHGRVPQAAFRKAVCLKRLSERSPRDERSLREALSAVVSFTVTYPLDDNVEQAREYAAGLKDRLELMYFDRAEYYDRISGNDKAALIAYGEFVKQFPASRYAVKAQDRIDEIRSGQGI